MTDISKIHINPTGSDHNIKDATARAGIESSKTIKSSVVTVNDAAPINAEDITVDITPVQDLHGLPFPYVGGAYKNKYQMRDTSASNRGVEVVANSDGTLQLSGTATGGSAQISLIGNWSEMRDLIAAGGTYVMSYSEGTYSNLTLNATITYKETEQGPAKYIVPNNPVIIPQGSIYYGSTLWVPEGATVQALTHFAIQLEAGSTPTSFAYYANICPIEGWTGAELDRVGKNWLPMTADSIKSASSGWANNEKTINGVKFTLHEDRQGRLVGIEGHGTASSNVSLMLTNEFVNEYNGLKFSGCLSSISDVFLSFAMSQSPWTENRNAGGSDTLITIPNDKACNVFLYVGSGKTLNHEMFYPMISTDGGAYEPYQGQQYTASFGETVYGGKWHVTEGGTDKTHGNIANYNGETINEPWLSSMDEYSPGATPTIGAQVVYPLTTPTTISTPKQNVPMLQGINTVSADCGDTSLKYQPDNVIGELKGEIEDNIIYEDFKWTTNSSQSYSAGTPGTYGTSSWRNVAKEGYDVIGVTFVENRRFGDCILTLYYIPSTNHVEVIIFRATSSAVTIADEDIVYRVAYKKA